MLGPLERQILFITGKGGVGKTTVASAFALLAAQEGRRTLLCELDGRNDIHCRFDTGPLAFEERQVARELWAMSMDTEQSLAEYLRLFVRLPLAGRLGPVAKAFDFVATAAPGVREILTIGKICWEAREGGWDTIVVDASATGHIVGQLAAPQSINELVKVGLIRQQTGWMLDILSDHSRTGAVVVATPEEMPVQEAVELVDRIETDTPVGLTAVLANRVLPELFGRGEEEVFSKLSEPSQASLLEREAGDGVATVLRAARLAVALRRASATHLAELRKAVRLTVPMIYLPFLFDSADGLAATTELAAALGAEIGT